MTKLEPFAHQQYLNLETFRKSGVRRAHPGLVCAGW